MKLKELFETEERSILSVMGKQKDTFSGYFSCGGRQLTSLCGAPYSINGNFSCHNNFLTSLIGAPQSVSGYFACEGNRLTSLKGAPQSIGSTLHCESNKLTSLKGIHKQIKHIGATAFFGYNPIKSHVLGLLKIDGLQEVFLDKQNVEKILNKYLKRDKDIFACQEELIEAGFPEFAQL